ALYSLSLHDALPICPFRVTGRSAPLVPGSVQLIFTFVVLLSLGSLPGFAAAAQACKQLPGGGDAIVCSFLACAGGAGVRGRVTRSEEHTSELQSQSK